MQSILASGRMILLSENEKTKHEGMP